MGAFANGEPRPARRARSSCAPEKFSPEQLAALHDVAALVETELQHNQSGISQRDFIRQRDDLKPRASIDGLTRLWTRDVCMKLLNSQIARAERHATLTMIAAA